MVQSDNAPGGDVDIKVKVILLVEDAKRQLAELGTKLTGGAASMAGGAGAAMGIGPREATADGAPTRTKEQDERAKVRTNALQTLAKSAPGGGLATTMAKSFSQGGMMSGIATGITAVVGILTGIMKSSQVFQTMAGTVFKILGMMADLFLMPFVPLMMKFAGWMIQHMPDVIKWGEETAKWVERLFNFFTGRWGQSLTDKGKEEGGIGGFFKRVAGAAFSKEGLMIAGGAAMIATGVGAPLGAGLVAGGAYGMASKGVKGEYQMGGKVPGGPGAEVQATLHGGEIVVPQDIAAGGKEFGGRVASWIERFQQKEMGPGGVMEKWYDEMFGGSIMPKIWSDIHGFFGGIETETESISKRVGSDTEKLEGDQKSFWDKLKFWEYLPEIWGKVSEFFSGLGGKLKDFFTFDVPFIDLGDAASTVGACFARAGSAIGNFFTNTLPNAAGTAKDAVVDAVTAGASYVSEATVNVYNNVADKTKTAGEKIKGFFTDTIPRWAGNAKDAVVTAAQWVWGIAETAGKKVWSGLQTAGGAVKGFFADTIPTWAGTAKDAVVTAAKYTWGVAKTVGGLVKTGLSAAGTAVGGFFSETLPGWAGTAKDKVVELAGNVVNTAKNIGGWAYRGLSSAGSSIGGFFTGTLPGWTNTAKDKVVELAGDVFNTAAYIGSWTYRGLKSAGSSIGGFFTGTLPGWATGAKDKVVELVGKVPGVASWIFSNISSALSSATSAVSSFVSGLASKVWSVGTSIWNKVTGGGDQYGNTPSNYDDINAFGNSVTGGGIHHFGGGGGAGGGPRFAMGVPQRNGGGVTSNRVVNVNIISSLSIHDIVRDAERLDSIQEAAFFNTV